MSVLSVKPDQIQKYEYNRLCSTLESIREELDDNHFDINSRLDL